MPEPIMFPTIRLTPLSSEISFLSCMLSLGGCMSWDESLALPFILLASSSAAMMPSSLDWASRNRGPAVDTTDPYPISGNLWNNLSNTFRRSIDFFGEMKIISKLWIRRVCCDCLYISNVSNRMKERSWIEHRTEVWDEHERGRAVKVWTLTADHNIKVQVGDYSLEWFNAPWCWRWFMWPRLLQQHQLQDKEEVSLKRGQRIVLWVKWYIIIISCLLSKRILTCYKGQIYWDKGNNVNHLHACRAKRTSGRQLRGRQVRTAGVVLYIMEMWNAQFTGR